MILVMRKTNVLLGVMIVVLAVAIIGVNIGFSGSERQVSASGDTIPVLTTAGKIVVLDAGHGGEDPGAVSSFSGAKEKDINLTVTLMIKTLLEESGYTVIMTRSEDILKYDNEELSMTAKRRQDLLARKKIMDESGADIVVSIHLNSFTDAKYYGAQTFYTKESPSSKKLAICLQTALRENIDPENKREALLKSNDIIITKNCKVTTAIVECGFLSNETEEKLLVTQEYQTKLAEAVKKGIDQYFTVEVPAPSGGTVG